MVARRKALDPAQQNFQKVRHLLFAAGSAAFAALLNLVPQASQFAFHGLYSASVAGGLAPFAQFPPEMPYFSPDFFDEPRPLSLRHSRTSLHFSWRYRRQPIVSVG
jgi:hypothetical protein